jgi:hypothetical protein
MSEFEEAIGPDRRTFLKRLVLGAAFAAPVVSSFTMSGMKSVFASPPRSTTLLADGNTAPPPAIPDHFPTAVGNCFVVPFSGSSIGGPIDQTVQDAPRNTTLHLVVPDGALPFGTQVCIYRADLSSLTAVVPAGQTPVSGYAVVWNSPGNVQPDALHAITLTVTDPAAPGGGTIFVLNKQTGAPTAAGTASAGSWTVTFVVDPGYVVTSAVPAVNATFTG